MNASDVKVCTGCNRELPLSGFYHHPHKKDGLQSRCRKCQCMPGGYSHSWLDGLGVILPSQVRGDLSADLPPEWRLCARLISDAIIELLQGKARERTYGKARDRTRGDKPRVRPSPPPPPPRARRPHC